MAVGYRLECETSLGGEHRRAVAVAKKLTKQWRALWRTDEWRLCFAVRGGRGAVNCQYYITIGEGLVVAASNGGEMKGGGADSDFWDLSQIRDLGLVGRLGLGKIG